MSAKSLARFGFDVNAKLNGLDPASGAAEIGWMRCRGNWEHIAEAIEVEVLRRHGITVIAAPAKPQVDIIKLNAEMSGR